MANNADGSRRQELLAQVKAKHRAAGNKVSRLKSDGGVKIAGTQHDVRRDIKKVEKYNTKQLQTYLGQLNTFTSRSTKFYGDKSGRVLDPKEWQMYKELERAVRAKERREFNQIKDIHLPKPGTSKKTKTTQTIEERKQAMLPTRPQGKNRTTNSHFNTPDRKPQQIASAKSLEVMRKALTKKLSGDYKGGEIAEQRRIFSDMLDTINSDKLKKQVEQLSDRQFDIMWNHTSMPDDIVEIYVLMRHDEDDTDEQHQHKLESVDAEKIRQSEKAIGAWLGWAKSLKLNG